MGIGVVVVKIIAHCLDHRSRHLGSARPIEVSNRITVMSARERRKTSTYFFGRHHRGGGGELQSVCRATDIESRS